MPVGGPRRVELPSFRAVADALRTTTERLACELEQPADRAPDWSAFEWDVARAVAALQGVSAALAHRLRWQGPPAWQSFLAQECREIALRDAKLGELLGRIHDVALRHSIAVVALKGAALRRLGFWRDPIERPMGDVDLLVQQSDLPALARALGSIGYCHSHAGRRHVAFNTGRAPAVAGFGESSLNPIPVEVHTRIAEPLPVAPVDITARLWPTTPVAGVNPYASDAALLGHLLLHCAGNMRAHALRLAQLRDVAALSARMSVDDWNTWVRAADCWWVHPPLQLTARYFPGSIPAEVLAASRDGCPPWLRRTVARQTLTDVSWSNLRIAAFPGIEWSRTPGEALRFARSRIAPDRQALSELEYAQQVLPGLRTIPWYGQRHVTRIARWLFTRPPRVQTLRSVLDALQAGQNS